MEKKVFQLIFENCTEFISWKFNLSLHVNICMRTIYDALFILIAIEIVFFRPRIYWLNFLLCFATFNIEYFMWFFNNKFMFVEEWPVLDFGSEFNFNNNFYCCNFEWCWKRGERVDDWFLVSGEGLFIDGRIFNRIGNDRA